MKNPYVKCVDKQMSTKNNTNRDIVNQNTCKLADQNAICLCPAKVKIRYGSPRNQVISPSQTSLRQKSLRL